MRAEDVRRWLASHRAAEERELAESRRAGPDPAWAIASALALVALTGRLHGWPVPEDEVTHREDMQGYEQWARLRSALRDRGPAG